jgi:SAM-dependent methyltransferase/glycosyltransferase involved in cell wall biosynthesis
MVNRRFKLIMTLAVRNEADVIRHNIDFHLNQGVDFIMATDNGSVDGTREILVEYEKKGVLHLLKEREHTARQALWVNRMGRIAFEDYKADIIFHCDADEFWQSKTGNLKDEFLKEADTDVLVVNLVNVLLQSRNGAESFPADSRWAVVNPIETDNLEEDAKGENLYLFRYPAKVIFKTNKKFLEVTSGNHAIANMDSTINLKISKRITIYHYPLRSKAQFFNKVKNFGVALETHEDNKKLGWHIRRWFASYRDGLLDREYNNLTLGANEIKHLLKAGRIEEIDFERFTMKKNEGKTSEAISEKCDAMKKGLIEHSIIFDSSVKKGASAWTIHTTFALFVVSILKPKLFVELGVHTGYSYNAFCRAVKELKTGTRCYGIDTWIGDKHAGLYGEDVYQQLLEYQLKEYSEFSHLLRMAFDEGLTYFSNQGIDLLHIDGLHTYEAVKHDFEEWLPKMSDKGVILVHDTMVRERDFGVWRLWEEIASRYPSFNFTHGCGLGIVAVGSDVSKEFLDFLNEANTNPFCQKLFSSLGMLWCIDAVVEERDSRIGSLEEAIRKKEAVLNNIYDSHGWKALIIYYKIRDEIFPLNTKRRLFAKRIFKAIIKLKLLSINSVRKAFYLSTDIFRKFKKKYDLTPPRSMTFVGDGDFRKIGEEFKGYFLELGRLKPEDRVLDVGCGIGRMAVPLTPFLSPQGGYWGFDIVKKGIEWCQSHIVPRYRNFHFFHSDIHNKIYNPSGKIIAKNFRFPFEDAFFDFVFLTSVFTHMLPPDTEHYLSEISRVMKPGARCLITFFLITKEARDLIDMGSSTQSFKYEIDGCLTVIENSPEAAIAYDQELILRLFQKNDLKINKPIHYGSWCGRTSFLSYQDIIVATKLGKDQR